MLVPAMNPMEIYKEIVEDAASVMKMVTTKIHIQTHVMKRTHQLKWTETLHIKTERKNDWSVVINLSSAVKDINFYIKTNDRQGLTAYSLVFIDNMPVPVKYNAHFFKRYRERMELDETKPDQIIKRFFKNNIHITPAYGENEENGNAMAVISLPEGLGLGRFSKESPITEMKTFIATSMLNKGQSELLKMLSEDESFQQGLSFIGQ